MNRTVFIFALVWCNGCSESTAPVQKTSTKSQSNPEASENANATNPNEKKISFNEGIDEQSEEIQYNREIYGRLSTTLSDNPADPAEAFDLCNTILHENTLSSRGMLINTMATAIYKSNFGDRCMFNDVQLRRLDEILSSNLHVDIKSDLLKQSSASTEGMPDASARVLRSAFAHTRSASVLASITGDIARVSPQKAAAEFSNRPWLPEYSLATARLYAEYVISNPEDGSKAVALLNKDLPQYQWAVAGVVQAIRGADPVSADIWRKEIKDPDAAKFADALSYSLRENP